MNSRDAWKLLRDSWHLLRTIAWDAGILQFSLFIALMPAAIIITGGCWVMEKITDRLTD
jgi:hypothetical protein